MQGAVGGVSDVWQECAEKVMLSRSWKIFKLRAFLEFNYSRWELLTFNFICWHCPRSLDCLVIWSHLSLVRWKLHFSNTESFRRIKAILGNWDCRGRRSPATAVL